VVRELRDDLAVGVHPLFQPMVVPKCLRSQPVEDGGERFEHPHAALPAVGVVGVEQRRRPVGAEQGGIAEFDAPVGALEAVDVGKGELLSPTQEVALDQTHAPARLSPGGAGRQRDLRSPGVLRDDLHVHHAVVGLARLDLRGLEKVELTQVPLGLGQNGRVVGVALLEQKKLPNRVRPRSDVERVGGAVDPSAFRLLGSKHVEARDGDPPDP
jgi:hypothetical protein